MKNIVAARFPKGWAWSLDPLGQLSQVLIAREESILSPIIDRAGDCGTVRNPFFCQDVNALADEFGAEPFTTGDIERFRSYLSTIVYTPNRTGSDTDIQNVLLESGYIGATVITNHHLQDFRPLVQTTPACWCGNPQSVCGNDTAFAGLNGYRVLANGDITDEFGNRPGYDLGDDPEYWGYVFIVCGGVTLDGNGLITGITTLEVSKDFEQQFKRLILRTKPIHSWAILFTEYVVASVIAQTGGDLPIIAQTGDVTIPIIAQVGT